MALVQGRNPEIDEMLAGKVGKSTRYIYRRLKLNNLWEDYRPYLENGSLSATTAEVLSAYPLDAQKAIFKTTFYVTGDGTKIFDTGIRIKNALERETCNKLKKAFFPIDEADLQPGLVACTACEKKYGGRCAVVSGRIRQPYMYRQGLLEVERTGVCRTSDNRIRGLLQAGRH